MAKATIVVGNIIGLVIAVPLVVGLVPSPAVLGGGKSWSNLKDQSKFDALTPAEKPAQIYFSRTLRDGYMPPEDASDYVWGVKMNDDQIAKMKAKRADLFENPGGKVDYPAVTLGYAIFSSVCPHLGCKFSWKDEIGHFFCPCHNSEYERDGTHIAGPAARGLDPLPLQEQSGKAQIEWIRYKAAIPDRIVVSYT
jgi:nitrite reductase/ring-hydroxylating ferredoxin subunit